MATERRYDIDCLRVIAISLLLIYHVGIAFQPWGVFIGFIQNDQPMTGLWIPMSMLNVWRIPLLFFVSGMGVSFALRKRNLKQLIKERSMRILVPLLFGIFFIVPVHIFLRQTYYMQDPEYTISLSHLWFLANIFIYVILLLPLFYVLKKRPESKFMNRFRKIFKSPLGIILLTAAFIIESLLAQPESFASYAISYHGFFLGFIAFLSGFMIIESGKKAQQLIIKGRFIYVCLALSLFLIRYLKYDLQEPVYISAPESVFWILSIFGFGFKYLNRKSRMLTYLSRAVYPIYIVHMIFLYLSSYFIMTADMNAWIKFLLVNSGTFAGSLVFYEFIIRRISFIRPLFGLKRIQKSNLKPIAV